MKLANILLVICLLEIGVRSELDYLKVFKNIYDNNLWRGQD